MSKEGGRPCLKVAGDQLRTGGDLEAGGKYPIEVLPVTFHHLPMIEAIWDLTDLDPDDPPERYLVARYRGMLVGAPRAGGRIGMRCCEVTGPCWVAGVGRRSRRREVRVAHDRRTGVERWAWLMTISEEEMTREWDRVRAAMRVSLQTDLPSDQRVGDLVVYCGSVTGVIVGVGQVAGEPRQRGDDTSGWRIRILPILVMDRHIAPSILAAGSDLPRTPARLDPGRYRRVRELILSAAVPLDPEAAPSGAGSGAGGPRAVPDVVGEADVPATRAEGGAPNPRIDDEPWAWLTSVSEEQLERDWDRVRAAMAISVDAAILPTRLDVGDLVVYCGSDTGIIAGIGELVGGPLPREAGAGDWRIRVAPRLLLDRGTAPSIDEAGVRPPRLAMHLETETYSRVRDLILSAAVPLKRRSHA